MISTAGRWILVLVVAGVPLTGSAQTIEDAPPPRSSYRPLLGIRYSAPFKLSAYGGVALAEVERHRTIYKIGVVGELGASGGQISVTSGAAGGHTAPFVVRGQVSALRTWRTPLIVGPDETFVGLEARVLLMIIGVGIGVFRRIGEGEGDPVVILGGVHFGI